jgi:hypothetical protein
MTPAPAEPDPKPPECRNAVTSPRSGYWLSRLRATRPDLARRVDAGEISAYAAAVSAGLRRRPDAVDEVKRRVAALDREQFRAVFAWLLAHARGRR